MKSVPMRGSAGSMVRIPTWSGDVTSIAARWRMACRLTGISSGTGVDPTLPRDGTDFITLQVAMRVRVWLRRCGICGCFLPFGLLQILRYTLPDLGETLANCNGRVD